MKTKEEILKSYENELTPFEISMTTKYGALLAMEEYGKLMYNQAIDDIYKITYEQTLESGAKADCIDTYQLLRLKLENL